MTNLVSRRYLWFTLSLILIVPGTISLILFGLRLGIDFTGGTLWELQFARPQTTAAIDQVLIEQGYDGAIIQQSGASDENIYLIRLPEITEGSAEKAAIEAGFAEQLGDYTEREFSTIGGAVSTEIRNRAVLALIVASVGILLYLAYAFRNTQNPLLYGMCAIAGMVHDVLIVLGIFSILGVVANVEVDALFVTALLTVIGFSVHDTIVVFDRIRENLALNVERKITDEPFAEVVNYSLAQTVVRSLNNSITVVFTLIALFLFGGSTTRDFVLALLIGVISGTYSSIFNASQLLVAWEYGEIQRFFGRVRGRRSDTAPAPAP
ncbi:MAG: protein translocase subunit SecF [Chloroflexota bacterium]|nr:protein translocase subunit SecF [Chloroflexota bacterium]